MADPAPPPTQPPPPFTQEGTSTSSKSPYRSARQNELDALRQKGLTKIFNRHFTSAAERIQEERKEAEKALQDIIKRKAELAANPKLFKEGGLTLTQLETLHQELQRRKHDVQRKEKETQELYKRYVSQYGVPGSASKDSPINQMPVLHENTNTENINIDTFRQRDLLLAKQSEKSPTSDVNVDLMGKNFEDGKYSKDIISRLPCRNVPQRSASSYEVQTASQTPNSFTPIKFQVKNGSHFPESPTSQLTKPDYTPTSVSGLSTRVPQDPANDNNDRSSLMVSPSPSVDTKEGNSSILKDVMVLNDNLGSNEDTDSTMSGLTSIDGATVAEAEWKLTEFLRVESDNIRRMLAGTAADMSVDSTENHSKDDSTALTSAGSKAVTEATQAAEEMARKMEEATAWLEDPTLLENDSDEENDETQKIEDKKVSSPPSKQNLLEWQAFWSANHEREYYHNTTTNQTCWSKPRGAEIDMSRVKEIKPEITQGKGDTVVVRDYTRTTRDTHSVSSVYQTNEQAISEYRPDNDSATVRSSASTSVTKSSKVMEYRRKMKLKAKRRRKKIRILVAICALSSVGFGLHKSKERWMPWFGLQTQAQRLAELELVRVETERAALEQFEREQKKIAEEEKRQKLLIEKAEAEMEAKIRKEAEALRKKQEEEKLRKEAEALWKKQEEKKRREKAEALKKKQEDERRRKEAEDLVRKQAEIERVRKEEEINKKKEEDRLKQEAARKAAEEYKLRMEEEHRLAKIAVQKAKKEKEQEEKRQKDLLAATKEAEEQRLRDEVESRIREEERRKIQAELLEKEWRIEQERKQDIILQGAIAPIKGKHILICYIPFSYIFFGVCRRKTMTDPVFDLKALTDYMME